MGESQFLSNFSEGGVVDQWHGMAYDTEILV